MKTKTNMKITNNYKNSFRCGYCDLQNIFYAVNPQYYNCGVYGWNCDLYIDIPTDTIISTGYRNMRGKSINHDIIKKYDTIARNIIDNYTFKNYDLLVSELEKNRNNFLNEIINNN